MSSTITRDDQVWLPDGNAIVLSEDNIAFRVHLGTIAHRSEIFRDLFALPKTGTAETIDGCPVIGLPDSASDLRHLLLVLCCGKKYVPIVAPTRFIYVALTCVENVISYYYARDEVQQVPFAVLETLIRLGHKYAVQDVLQEALGRLKKYYPTTLYEWSDAVGRARWIQTTPADAIEVIELARLTDTPSLLPAAYLACCEILTSREHTDVLRTLPPEDLHRILEVSSSLSLTCALRMMAVLHPECSDECQSPETCAATIVTFSRDLATLERSVSHLRAAHLIPDAYVSLWEGHFSMCHACMTSVRRSHHFNRSIYWMHLPKVTFRMEIEGWQKEVT